MVQFPSPGELRSNIFFLFAKGLTPTVQITDTGDGESGAETGIETREELHRHTWYVLKADAQAHHEEDEHIAVQVKERKERFLAFGEVEYAGGVTPDEIIKHQREA